MTLSVILAAAASATYLARLLPQPIRTLRTGEVAGVSALAAMNAAVADAAWLVYGLSVHVVVVWAVAIPSIVFSLWTFVLLRRTVRSRDLAGVAAWAAAIVVCDAAGVLSLALAMTVLVTCGPQLWAALRHHDPSGLSRFTWLIAILDASTWGCYGLAIGNGALELYGVVLLGTALAILARLGAPSRRAQRQTVSRANMAPTTGRASNSTQAAVRGS